MEGGFKSLSSSSAAKSPSSLTAPFPQPPLLPQPARLQASPPPPQPPSWPAPPAASAPIVMAPPPSKKEEELVLAGWASMYSVSPPPSSVPMPTSLLLAAPAGRKKAPTACAVEVAGGVDVGATDELRRLLRL